MGVSDGSDTDDDSQASPASHSLFHVRPSDLHELGAMSRCSRPALNTLDSNTTTTGYDGGLKIGDQITVSRSEVDNLELFEDGEEPVLFNVQLTRKQVLESDDVDKFLE